MATKGQPLKKCVANKKNTIARKVDDMNYEL